MRIKINDKIYRLKEVESGVDSLMELVEKPKYKDGDFLKSTTGSLFIHNGKYEYDNVCAHFYISGLNQRHKYDYKVCFEYNIAGFCSPEEVDMIHNELEKDGKRWNADKKCIEDIPKRKFKKGDKVRIRHGVSNKTHYNVGCGFVEKMDDLIGETMTVDRYTDGNYVVCEEIYWSFHEEWLEPYEELKKGDLAIFWDDDKKFADLRFYEKLNESEKYYRHKDNFGFNWKNAIKFESKEQYEKLIKREI